MDIVKELTRLHELAGETTVLNFRALMQNELRKLIEQAQEEAAQQSFAPDASCASCKLQFTSSCPSLLGKLCSYYQPRR